MRSYWISAWLLFGVITTLTAQDTSSLIRECQPTWDTIALYQQRGRLQESLALAKQLYQRLEKNQSTPDGIAAELQTYLMVEQNRALLEKEGLLNAIQRLEQTVSKETGVRKAVLQSFLAECYQAYYYEERYRILNRSNAATVEADLRTWASDRLVLHTRALYQQSLQPAAALRDVPIEEFRMLILLDSSGTAYRPTLYDLLLDRALAYYQSGEADLNNPAKTFKLNDARFFTPASIFVQQTFVTPDTLEKFYQVIQLYQQGLAQRMDDLPASVELDLRRLKFVNTESTLDHKEALYEKGLKALLVKSGKHEVGTLVLHQLAELYQRQGRRYTPFGRPAPRWLLKQAHELCEQAIQAYPNSYGARLCRDLMKEITYQMLSIDVENTQRVEQPILFSLAYRNMSQVRCVLLHHSESLKDSLKKHRHTAYKSYLLAQTPVKRWTVSLPTSGDFQRHRTELDVPALGAGQYLLLVYPVHSDSMRLLAKVPFQVSDLRLIGRKNGDEHSFWVVDATTGAPVSGARARFIHTDYYQVPVEGANPVFATSSSTGQIRVPKTILISDSRYSITITHEADTLWVNQGYYTPSREEEYEGRPTNFKTHFFLDRSIYRPGQTVYFKGLVLNHKNKTPRPVPAKKRSLVLSDRNGQTIWEKTLTTNAYGSVQDSIVLPLGVPLGNLTLRDESNDYWDAYAGSIRFRVEEYRRPKFEVKSLPFTTTHTLGDSVRILGEAKAYAGNAIANAAVAYVIRRLAVTSETWYYREAQHGAVQAKGIVQTKANGSYSIPFLTSSDTSESSIYNYHVAITVTDITGETQELEHEFTIGARSIDLSFTLPEYGFQKDLAAFPIFVTPFNGTLPTTQGTVTIEQLEAPNQVYHTKPWGRADVFALDASKFKTLFPNRPYQQEHVLEQWPVLETVHTQSFTIEQPRHLLQLEQLPQLKAGTYRVTLQVQDINGQPIQQTRYITLAKANTQALSSHLALPTRIEPGQRFQLHLASGLQKATVFYELEDFERVRTQRWISFAGETTVSIPITKAYRGGGRVRVTMIADGQLYQETHTLPVPWTGQGLKVVFKTFRSTLKPGQQETWTVQIKHAKGHPMQAEVLANLYDASLDALSPHAWRRYFLPSFYPVSQTLDIPLFDTKNGQAGSDPYNHFVWNVYSPYPQDRWRLLLPSRLYGDLLRSPEELEQFFGSADSSMVFMDGMPLPNPNGEQMALYEAISSRDLASLSVVTAGVAQADVGVALNANGSRATSASSPNETGSNFDAVTVRRNLKETVFFKPHLRTDARGQVSLEFTMNEALTKWKFMLFAHSKRFQYGYAERFVVTQKELMVTPNPPRFFRQGDQVEFTAKVVNLTDKVLQGKAQLFLFDALTMESIGAQFGLSDKAVDVSAVAKGSARLAWTLRVPEDWTRPVLYRVVAEAGDYSDGEEAPLPVLTNRFLVTETQPLPIRGQQTKTFEFDRLKTVSQSPTLKHHRLVVEFNQNPAWSAVQSLPYLMTYPHQCTEQLFSRYYANALASHVANSQPHIKAVFERWRDANPTGQSPLLQNEDLKYALLAETPWVLDAQDQAQQQKNLGLLFDLHTMEQQRNKTQQELLKRQNSGTGGFSWMPDGPTSPYITQYLVASFGHLNTLGIVTKDQRLQEALKKAVQYLDAEAHERYQRLLRQASQQPDSVAYMKDNHLTSLDVHYLYARSFFLEVPVRTAHRAAFERCQRQAQAYWYEQSLYGQALLGLGLHRLGDTSTPTQVVNALRQQALMDEELGMYWKAKRGYFWYELPIERHCAMIELFEVVAQDAAAVENLKIWLLKQRQTTHWKTTKATAAACYALLMTGDDWLVEDQDIALRVGDEVVDVGSLPQEAGTGYFQTAWEGAAIRPEMGTIQVTNPNKSPAWGAVYWQYFEQLDRITTFAETPLQLDKQLFKEVIQDNRPILQPLEKQTLQPGDKVVVRIVLRVDRPMEYVHMKDQRAAGLEPLNQLSQYKWQDGLGYYESTRDAATDFFFSYLPKGTYVFEYPLRVNLQGDFSNGITTIQCMYAPEFTAHSEGVRVAVE